MRLDQKDKKNKQTYKDRGQDMRQREMRTAHQLGTIVVYLKTVWCDLTDAR